MKNELQIIILNFKSSEDTIELYRNLKKEDLDCANVLVINNFSNAKEEQKLKDNIPSRNLMLLSQNKGYAVGNKFGIQEAKKKGAEFVLLLNPDIRLDKHCILQLLNAIKNDSSIAAIGPRICFRDYPDRIYSDGGLLDKERGFYTSHLNSNKTIQDVEGESSLHFVDYVNGSVFLARTSVFNNIGFMREDFFLYFEETEWCLRAKSFGYTLATEPKATAYHSSSKKGSLYHYYMTRNRILFSRIVKQYRWITIRAVIGEALCFSKRSIKQGKMPIRILLSKIIGLVFGILTPVKR